MRRAVIYAVVCVGVLLVGSASGAPKDVWTGVDRVVAVGDVHGDFGQFVTVLRDAGVIDEDDRWIGGETHLVQLGDFLDRGPDSRKIMDVLMRLEREAERAGGRVHVLLGNHEAMNVYGDLRYVSEGEYAAFRDEGSDELRESFYTRFAERNGIPLDTGRLLAVDPGLRARFEAQYPLGYVEHRRAFSASGTYGKWLRELNAIVKINDVLFVHGGIGPKYASMSIGAINKAVRKEMSDDTLDAAAVAESVMGDSEGPLWYRGLMLEPEHILEPHVDATLARHEATRIVVAHTITLLVIAPRFGGKVIGVDVGISSAYRGPAASLEIEDGTPYAVHRGVRFDLDRAAGLGMVDYLQRAAELEPDGSLLKQRMAGFVESLPKPEPVPVP